jgi:hypothetical protein
MTTEATVAATPILPPSASADGKRNAYYTQCKAIESTKPYAMCQYIIDHKDDGSMATIYSDCLTAIRRGNCAAVGMREEEKLKGQAIYFIERVKGAAVVAQQDAWVAPVRKASRSGYVRDKYAAGVPIENAPRIATPRPAAPAPKKPAYEFDGNIYAAALNVAVKKEVNATNRQPQPAPVPAAAIAAPAPTLVSKPVAAPVAAPAVTIRAGESPLELARRLRAQQNQ